MSFWRLPRPTAEYGTWGQGVYEHLRQLFNGKMDIVTTVTLTHDAGTTTFNDPRIGPDSAIFFSPTTSNAAAAMTNLRVTSKGKQTATLTHSNTATTDRTFDVVIIG